MMRAVTLKGLAGVGMMTTAEVSKAAVKKGTDVLIKVMAAGVNRADVSRLGGHYATPGCASDFLGLDVLGIVEQVG
ncbi:hypothetical protein CUR178_05483 [Leishmania enriettii]|uniref:Alcohol dehydrogenase-like N-terminal domain-containing protein n=1 Tax=Leishmania enriettii TaxID=5663 RepID=A0A836GBH7_LEIEN|nr:hypothetical protein CUR178_05483 [Leishmania enriettii]